MLSNLRELAEIDILGWFIATIVFILIWKGGAELKDWFCTRYGIETKKMKEKREDHDLLIKTAQNLALLQEKSEKDDRGLEIAFEVFIDEVRESFEQVHKKFEEINEARSKEKEQSSEIQKQLTESIKQLVDSQNSNIDKISALMCGSKELLGNTIDERYAKYIELGGIPQNEIDEFDSIFEAYKNLNGNHGRETKYEYVKNHLPVIPVKTELLINQK